MLAESCDTGPDPDPCTAPPAGSGPTRAGRAGHTGPRFASWTNWSTRWRDMPHSSAI